MNTTDRGLVQRQRDVMKLQDDMIMEIEQGVGTLHGKALAIGEETKIQSRLLDDLDSNVDIATAALQVRHSTLFMDVLVMCFEPVSLVG